MVLSQKPGEERALRRQNHTAVWHSAEMHKMALFLHLPLNCKLAEGHDFVVASFCAPNRAIPAPVVIWCTREAEVRSTKGCAGKQERGMGPGPCWWHWLPLMESLLPAWHCARQVTDYVPLCIHNSTLYLYHVHFTDFPEPGCWSILESSMLSFWVSVTIKLD